MLGYLWRILVGRFGCEHKWEVDTTGPIMEDYRHVGTYYNLRCEKCGDAMKRKLI